MIKRHYTAPHRERVTGGVKVSVAVTEGRTMHFVKDQCYSLVLITLGLNGADDPQGFMHRATIGLDGVS